MTQPDNSIKSSFWTSLPGILTGGAALITALGGVYALISNRTPDARDTNPPARVEQSASIPGTRDKAANPASTSDAACYDDYLRAIPADHRKSVNLGTRDYVLLGAQETKKGVFAVGLTNNDQPLGIVRLTVNTQDQTFHIEQAVDAACQPIPATNASRSGDAEVLQNWDDLNIRIKESAYVLRLGYDAGEVTVGYFRRIVE